MHIIAPWQSSYARSISILATIALAAIIGTATPIAATPPLSTFTLANGLQVVVIPDHRAPVVTHMIWYRVGGADDPWGTSGVAHFFEHLMFKATAKHKTGAFSRLVSRLGGRHNALTSLDATSYFQRVAKQHLRAVMELEADRMINLQLVEKEVLTERNVVREERRSSVDASAVSLLSEQMLAALYQNHPYGRPVLGWAHEIAQYTLQDVATFYERYYAPNNAVLVVAGDVAAQEVHALAQETYGRIKRRRIPKGEPRPREPKQIAPRWIRLTDERIGPPIMLRFYSVPSHSTAKPGEVEALMLLARILGGDDTSRLYQNLVVLDKTAAQAGADHQAGERDSARIALLAVAGKDLAPARLEAALDKIVNNVRVNGVTNQELDRAKLALETERVFDTDNQERRARQIGKAVVFGRSIADIEGEAARIDSVTIADIKRVANLYLVPERSVTGTIVRPKAKAGKTAAKR